jgi:micrococcal nuclease
MTRMISYLIVAALAAGAGAVAFGGSSGSGGSGPGSSSAGLSPNESGHDTIDRVVDGDTVKLTKLGRVRLIGVDTPEVYFHTECFGKQASAFTKHLLPAGTAVSWHADAEPRDRYGRALVYLYDGSTFVNAELVRRGYASQLTIPPDDAHADEFGRLARGAREQGRGLWGACGGNPR